MWLVNYYIPESIQKSVGGFKDKILSLFKTKTAKQTVYGRGKKPSKPKTLNIRNSVISGKNTKKKLKTE